MAASRLEFGVLGPLEVRVDGASLRVGGPKQRALLALLLLSANRVVSRDRLIEELLDDPSAEAADHTLRVQVSRLRKALTPEGGDEPRLVARPPGYLLRVEPGELDLDAFELSLAAGRRALEGGNPQAAADTLREGESLWRGRPLADLEFERFARVEVERLEELHLAAVEERIDAELALGLSAALVAELEPLVADHPLRERLRGQLMLALYRCGRQGEGLAVYRETSQHLLDELGIKPSPMLQQLEQAILRQDPALELLREERLFQLAGPGLRSGFGPPRTQEAQTPGVGTFLFADLVGFGHIIRILGDEATAALVADYQATVTATVAAHDGVVIERAGDHMWAVFRSAGAAVRAAAAVRETLRDFAWASECDVTPSIILHSGRWSGDPSRPDAHTAFLRVLRLEPLVEPGQVLVSQTTAALLEGDRDAPALRRLGERIIPDFDEPMHLYEMVEPEQSGDHPIGRRPASGFAALKGADDDASR